MQLDLNLLRIVRFQPHHTGEVCDIEYRSFKNPFPKNYILELSRAFPRTFLVAELGNQVIGYLVASVSGEQAHIISIAVDEKFRRRHVGTYLLKTLIKILKVMKVREVALEVRLDNAGAKILYEKFGFEAVRYLKGYYEDGGDALIYRLMVDGDV
ncbi:MAG: ribosomal protein S18-alanine N-acetyltransferase [Candidatus Bathyarchaeia archaeon]